jgi:PAS domain S-box-containing protein
MKRDDTLRSMTWQARPDMSCEHASRAWLDYTGYSLEQALDGGWARAVHPDDLTRRQSTSARACDERRAFEIEYRLQRRDGEYRWILERAAPRYSPAGEFLGFAGACTDIDELLATVARLVQPVGT